MTCRICAGPVGVKNEHGFCAKCAPAAFPCGMDDCLNRCAAHTRSFRCSVHRVEAQTMRRKGIR